MDQPGVHADLRAQEKRLHTDISQPVRRDLVVGATMQREAEGGIDHHVLHRRHAAATLTLE
jgi:hypothetical protein